MTPEREIGLAMGCATRINQAIQSGAQINSILLEYFRRHTAEAVRDSGAVEALEEAASVCEYDPTMSGPKFARINASRAKRSHESATIALAALRRLTEGET